MTDITLRYWLEETAEALDQAGVFLGHGTDNPWDEALHLTLPLLQIRFDASPDVLDRVLTPAEIAALRALRDQRIGQRIPVPYLTHEAWFCGLPFYVDERVLIPRSPIGEMIMDGFYPWLVQPPARILDLCCGSACIAIACAEAFPDAQVDASDLSPDALAVAAINVQRYGNHVRLVESDLFAGLAGERYDLIVCNPPYVDARDMAELPPEYRHEPVLALASGDDGLDFTRRLLREAPAHLTAQGLLVVEVGNSAEALEAAFPAVPFLWVEFAHGGDGVFVISAAELQSLAAASPAH